MARPEPGQGLGGAQAGMLPARRTHQHGHLRGNAVRAVMRRAAAIAQSVAAVRLKPVEPLVAGLGADAVAGAQLDQRIEVHSVILDETLTLVHGGCLLPGH
jgi:hypothetical protein